MSKTLEDLLISPISNDFVLPQPKAIMAAPIPSDTVPASLLPSRPLVAASPGSLSIKPLDSDINSISEEIQRHLTNWAIVEKSTITANATDTLRIPTSSGTNEISIKCLVSHLSKNSSFLAADKASCSNIFKAYLSDDSNVDFYKLIDLSNISKDQSIAESGKFFQNLYGFDLGLAQYVATDPSFKSADPVTQQNIINGVYDFINQSLNYLNTSIETYKILDPKLIEASYNILYLLNILNLKRATSGRSMEKMNEIYQELMRAVNENIEAYRRFVTSATPGEISSSEVSTANNSLILAIQEKIKQLDKQREGLNAVESMVKTQKERLKDVVRDPRVIKIGEELLS